MNTWRSEACDARRYAGNADWVRLAAAIAPRASAADEADEEHDGERARADVAGASATHQYRAVRRCDRVIAHRAGGHAASARGALG